MPQPCNPIPPLLDYTGDQFNLFPFGGSTYAGLQNLCYPTYDGFCQQLDIAIPYSTSPVPFVVFYHPGGFFQGSKEFAWTTPDYRDTIAALLQQGIAFASANYRTLDPTPGGETVGIKKPLFDCTAALQYLRHNAISLNLDPLKVVLQGASAGGSAAIWIGTNNEMKNMSLPIGDIRRQSTRVTAIVAKNHQATLDLRKWPMHVFNTLGFPADSLCVKDILEDIRFRAYYAVPLCVPLTNSTQVKNAVQTYLNNNLNYKGTAPIKLDMLNLLNSTDPPIWIQNEDEVVGFPSPGNCISTNREKMVHHLNHTKAFYDKLKTPLMPDYYMRIGDPTPILEDYRGVNYAGQEVLDFILNQI